MWVPTAVSALAAPASAISEAARIRVIFLFMDGVSVLVAGDYGWAARTDWKKPRASALQNGGTSVPW